MPLGYEEVSAEKIKSIYQIFYTDINDAVIKHVRER